MHSDSSPWHSKPPRSCLPHIVPLFPTLLLSSCTILLSIFSVHTLSLLMLFMLYSLPKNPLVVVFTTIFEVPALIPHLPRDEIFPSPLYLQRAPFIVFLLVSSKQLAFSVDILDASSVIILPLPHSVAVTHFEKMHTAPIIDSD